MSCKGTNIKVIHIPVGFYLSVKKVITQYDLGGVGLSYETTTITTCR